MDIGSYLNPLRRGVLFLLAIPIVVMIGIYVLLFTAPGNRLLHPYVASALSQTFGTPIIVDTFLLTPDHYILHLKDQENNPFSLDGNYSLISFSTQGIFKGYGGNADYAITFKRLSIDTVALSLHHLDIAALLHSLEYPSKSKSSLHGNITLMGLADRKITGDIRLRSTTESFTPSSIIEEESNLSLDLYEWLAEEDGNVKPFHMDCSADIVFDEIGVIEQLIGYPLRGKVALGSHVHGNQAALKFDFNSSIAKSSTHIHVVYKALLPDQVIYTMSHADVEKLFDLFNTPSPISGVLDANGMINPKIGTLDFTIRHGRTKPHILKQEYAITQPDLRFHSKVSAQISGDNAIHYQASIRSNLGRLESENTTTHAQMLAELLKTIH